MIRAQFLDRWRFFVVSLPVETDADRFVELRFLDSAVISEALDEDVVAPTDDLFPLAEVGAERALDLDRSEVDAARAVGCTVCVDRPADTAVEVDRGCSLAREPRPRSETDTEVFDVR